MKKVFETLSPDQRLEAAVQVKTPYQLARSLATFVGQFYDREDFDALARQVSGLYDVNGADRFRTQLNRRLYDRFHAPVAWETTSDAPEPAGRRPAA